ncbi:OPA3 family protein [Rutstroemia sp. NJR-2017a WRK4]|nr:OPA3 family protein [Rutstroemia sp. NJR-2017a WRK4]
MAIPVPRVNQSHQEYFRILLLSSVDLDPSVAVMDRVERLYHQTGGRNVGIIFLLQTIGKSNDTTAYLKLQVALTQGSLLENFQMPLLPLHSIEQLLPTIQIFHKRLLSPGVQRTVNTQFELLPSCTIGTAMTEHTRNILSDICHSIPDLVHAASSPDGQAKLRQWLSDSKDSGQAADEVIDFVR